MLRWFDGDTYSICNDACAGDRHVAIYTPGARVQVWSGLGIAIRPDDTAEAPTVRVDANRGRRADRRTAAGRLARDHRGTEDALRHGAASGERGRRQLPPTYAVDLGDMRLTAADEVTVHAIGKTFERSRAYTERIAHPIDVDIRDTSATATPARWCSVNVPDLDAASLRVLGSTRTARRTREARRGNKTGRRCVAGCHSASGRQRRRQIKNTLQPAEWTVSSKWRATRFT